MIDAVTSALLQCLLLIGLPYLLYLIFVKQKAGFLKWVGLFLPSSSQWFWSVIPVLIASVVIMAGPLLIFQQMGLITDDMLYKLGLTNQTITLDLILSALIKAVFQTALSEEVFFRGFIGKSVARKLGYVRGNLVQSILFGLPHGLPFILVYKAYLFGVTFFIGAGIVGYLQFRLNEKKANGSIVPSMIVHSTMNIISFL